MGEAGGLGLPDICRSFAGRATADHAPLPLRAATGTATEGARRRHPPRPPARAACRATAAPGAPQPPPPRLTPLPRTRTTGVANAAATPVLIAVAVGARAGTRAPSTSPPTTFHPRVSRHRSVGGGASSVILRAPPQGQWAIYAAAQTPHPPK